MASVVGFRTLSTRQSKFLTIDKINIFYKTKLDRPYKPNIFFEFFVTESPCRKPVRYQSIKLEL